MTDKYAGAMRDELFRKLTPEEEVVFRQWAHDNHSPTIPEEFGVFHPVIRDEWRKIDESSQNRP